jgi:hypothetical protein
MPRLPQKPTPKVMYQTLKLLAKTNTVPGARARDALEMLREHAVRSDPNALIQGVDVGFGIDDAFNLAMKPITVPLKYAWKGTKAIGRAIGIGKGGGNSPEQVRLARLQAAQKRTQAATARARAADAQSEAEYRAQQALAAAADAEADAADAEATSREAAMQTAEAQYLPGQAENSSETDDESGSAPPIALIFKKLARAKARRLAASDARTGIKRGPAALAFAANDWARKELRSRGIAV